MFKIYDVIIIGGGPAGITAGIYCSRQKLSSLLITKSFGGQMSRKAVNIENYPGFESISGIDLIKKFENQIKKQSIEIEIDIVSKVKKTNGTFSISTKGKKNFKAKAVIVASGADPRKLEIPGEKKFIGKGVSYCALCDGPMFSNKVVAVIGGGNSAFETAIALSNYTSKIFIMETGKEVRADIENQEKAKKTKKIEVLTNVSLKKITGKKFLDTLVYFDKKNKQEKSLMISGVFIEIGYQPADTFIKDHLVEFNEMDEIKINSRTCETKIPGIFAAGDVTDIKTKQIIVACGEGAKAAFFTSKYIKNILTNNEKFKN